MNSVLIDTSFIYAIYDQQDKNHLQAVHWANKTPAIKMILPDVVLVEATYLIRRNSSIVQVINFLKHFVPAAFILNPLHILDLNRSSEVMAQYLDARLDFVDCLIVAQAERLDIKQVCTFDRRDFALITPQHCDYLELLP